MINILIALSLLFGGCDGNGCIDNWGNEIPGITTNESWMEHMPSHVEGKMVFYAPGAMDATARYRELSCNDCVGYVSLFSPSDIGRKAWIKIDNRWYGPFLSVDCAKRGDIYSVVVIREEVIEVEFEFAEKLGMAEKTDDNGGHKVMEWYKDVEVFLPPLNHQRLTPYSAHLNKPINYREYFLATVETTKDYQPRVILTNDNVWKVYGKEIYWKIELSDFPLGGGGKHKWFLE
jgi:hypothetical protein